MDNCHDENQELSILRSAIENTNEAFITIDENHKVLFFNKAAEEIFGYRREEVIGHDLNVIMAPDCSRDHYQAVKNYLNTRLPIRIGHDTELVATRKNGETFPANISFSVSEVYEKTYFTGIVRDLTETRTLQERVIRSERLAALGQVVAEISHEIKNPLMMIGGFARQLARQARDEKSVTKLNIIKDEVLRLEELLKELRDFYLPRTLKTEDIDIYGLLTEVRSLVKDDCERKNIRTEFKTQGKPIIIEGDRDRLKQVFLNLVKNSIEAMEKGGNLSIQSKLNGDRVEISITDDGSGIPKSNQEKIFSPFFTTKRRGSGLGLSVSKRIIEEQAGSIIVFESEEGKGTVFKITLPVSQAAMKNFSRKEERRPL
jgi:two-component system sensor kinase FixL